jgi:hypothetical protein
VLPPEQRPPSPGPIIIGVGLAIVVVGVLVWLGAFGWFGRLPGDIRYESDSTRVYVPWVSMLVISIVLSVLSFVVRRFF